MFYPTASWVLYLNTEFFICPVRMKKITFSLSTVEQFLIREKVNATGISDGVDNYFLQ